MPGIVALGADAETEDQALGRTDPWSDIPLEQRASMRELIEFGDEDGRVMGLDAGAEIAADGIDRLKGRLLTVDLQTKDRDGLLAHGLIHQVSLTECSF